MQWKIEKWACSDSSHKEGTEMIGQSVLITELCLDAMEMF